MKLNEMNVHQKRAYLMLKDLYNDLVGGYENTLLDYPEDSEEYKDAKAALEDREALKQDVYAEAVAISDRQRRLKHINFAGKDWMLERVEKMLQKDGY